MDNQNLPKNESKFGWLKKWVPRVVFVVLGVIVLLELIWGARVLMAPVAKPGKLLPIQGGKISLFSPKKEYKVGDLIPISVRIFTGGHPTDGTDVILRYDSKALEGSGSANLRRGRIYASYPVLELDPKTGVVRISGITSGNQTSFNGSGLFALLYLKAKVPGKTTVAVDFKPGVTTDSNIVETKSAKDILDGVYNLDLNLK